MVNAGAVFLLIIIAVTHYNVQIHNKISFIVFKADQMFSCGLLNLPPVVQTVEEVAPTVSKKRKGIVVGPKAKKATQTKTLDFYINEKKDLDSVLNEWYWVPKNQVDETKLAKTLTAAPKSSGFSNMPPPTFPAYVETGTHLGLPRFFGYETFGKPKTLEVSMGEAMKEDLKFAGTIQNTEQQPQQNAIDAWLKVSGCGLVALPCGSGKTVVAIYCAWLKKRKTAILVHKKHLIAQWEERLKQFVPEARVGYLVQNKIDIEDKDFVLCMIPSVAKRNYEGLATFGTLIIDEAHHLAARTFFQSIPKFRSRYILALSATPDRKDGLTRFIYWLVGPMFFQSFRKDIRPMDITQLVYANEQTQKEIKYKTGKVATALMIKKMVMDPARNALIMHQVKELMTKVKRVLIVGERRTHLEYLHDELTKQGFECGLYIGQMSQKRLEESKSKAIVVASYGLASEALDLQGVGGLVMVTPWGSTEQVVGRLREDKQASQRYVVDIIDPYSIFEAMSWKRNRIYKELGYTVRRVNYEAPTFFG